MTEQTLQELFPILAAIKNPGDVQVMDEKELTRLGEEIRRMIIQTVSSRADIWPRLWEWWN